MARFGFHSGPLCVGDPELATGTELRGAGERRHGLWLDTLELELNVR